MKKNNLKIRRVELNQGSKVGYFIYDSRREGDSIDTGFVEGVSIKEKGGYFSVHRSYGPFNYGANLGLTDKKDKAEEIAHQFIKVRLDALVNEGSKPESFEEFAAA